MDFSQIFHGFGSVLGRFIWRPEFCDLNYETTWEGSKVWIFLQIDCVLLRWRKMCLCGRSTEYPAYSRGIPHCLVNNRAILFAALKINSKMQRYEGVRPTNTIALALGVSIKLRIHNYAIFEWKANQQRFWNTQQCTSL